MKTFKKTVYLLIALVMLMNIVTIGAVNAQEVFSEGCYHYTVADSKATITDADDSISGEITIPGTLGGYPVVEIGKSAFANKKITKVTIPEGIEIIGAGSFDRCTELKEVVMSDTVTEIKNGAFNNCTAMESIRISDNLVSVENFAFMSCKSLKQISFSDTLRYMGIEAFYGTESLTELHIDENNPYFLCENLTLYSKDKTVLYFCINKEMTEYESPDCLVATKPYAFWYAQKIKKIVFTESVSEIDYLQTPGDVENVTFLNPYCNIYDEEYTITSETISGYEKSTAHDYADKYNKNFVPLDCNHSFGFEDWVIDNNIATRECLTCLYAEEKIIESEEPSAPEEPTTPEEPEEELSFFEKVIQAIIDFFKKLFGIV